MDTSTSEGREKHGAVARKRKGGKFRRFLRGVGWTLAGLVALVLLLAVLGMIIPPPRDPKSKALDGEDFGLGFKVGDKWDVSAMDVSLSALGFRREDDSLSEIASQEVKEVEYPFYYASWWTRDGRMNVYASSQDKSSKAVIGDISISSFARTDWTREEARAFRKSVEQLYPDQEARTAYLSKLYAKEATKLYPQIATDAGLGFGTTSQDFFSAYGKPDVLFPSDYPASQLAFYFRDRLVVSLSLSNGVIASIMILKYPFLEVAGRLTCWYQLALAHLEARDVNRFTREHYETK